MAFALDGDKSQSKRLPTAGVVVGRWTSCACLFRSSAAWTQSIPARKNHPLDFETLVRMRIVMKRARFFMTINGKFHAETKAGPDKIREVLLQEQSKQMWLFA